MCRSEQQLRRMLLYCFRRFTEAVGVKHVAMWQGVCNRLTDLLRSSR